MIICLNTVGNAITLNRSSAKKGNDYTRTFVFDYSLLPFDNKIKAIHEILVEEVIKELNSERAHTLLIPDEFVFSDVVECPPLAKGKTEDIFNTRFRLLFTQPGDFYMSFREIERNKSKAVIQYTVANVNKIKRITDAFFERGVVINSIEFYSHHFINQFAKQSELPTGYLFIGEHNSELIIYKNDIEVLSQNVKFGEKELFDPENFLESAYNLNNNEAKKYTSYIKKNFASSVQASDDEILRTEIDEELLPSTPREIRVLKDQALENYVLKHNFRLLHGFVLDCLDLVNKAPWFIPVNSINVVCSESTYEKLIDASEEDRKEMYVHADFVLNDVLNKPVIGNSLFAKDSIVTEKQRRRIEWSKILTMELGGKKKKD